MWLKTSQLATAGSPTSTAGTRHCPAGVLLSLANVSANGCKEAPVVPAAPPSLAEHPSVLLSPELMLALPLHGQHGASRSRTDPSGVSPLGPVPSSMGLHLTPLPIHMGTFLKLMTTMRENL